MPPLDIYETDFSYIRHPVSPYDEEGVPGTIISGGYVISREKNHKLQGRTRYETANDILLNAPIVGAGMQFFLNMTAKPSWVFDPAKDGANGTSSDAAKMIADRVAQSIDEMADSWPRIVRRKAAFKYHGFGAHEWTAEVKDDGWIGFSSLESRPWHTIEQWDTDVHGAINGLIQRAPLGGEYIYLPRQKLVYLVDDSLTDSPEGIGLWRMLVEVYERYKAYSKIEGMGYERDLRGIPVGTAPYKKLMELVNDGTLTQAQVAELVSPIENFVKVNAKSDALGLTYDSSVHTVQTENGQGATTAPMFDMKLLSAAGQGFADIGNAIERCQWQMAVLCGVENLLVGRGSTGSKALSESKAKAFSMNVDSTLMDVVSAVNKDYIPPMMLLNRVPRSLWPRARAQSAAYLDAGAKAQLMSALGQAGAVTKLSDPAINDIRIEAGLAAVTKEMIDAEKLADKAALAKPTAPFGGQG